MISKSPEETKAAGKAFVASLIPGDRATIVELVGDLGAGKTTFMQGVGECLGVKGPLQSPTFVIGKHYDIADGVWKRLIHIDAYRLEHERELATIGWQQYVADPGNIIFIEWPVNMHTDLAAVRTIEFTHIHENERNITI